MQLTLIDCFPVRLSCPQETRLTVRSIKTNRHLLHHFIQPEALSWTLYGGKVTRQNGGTILEPHSKSASEHLKYKRGL